MASGEMQADELPALIEVEDSWEAVQDLFEAAGWTDGLPIVPPTPDRVRAMLAFADGPPEEVVATLAPRNGEATLQRIATNAVMAGCQPEYLPVVLAAVRAVAEPAFNLNGIQATTHPCAVFILVNGPLAVELGINCGANCFGQGWRANASIGRAMRLILQNIGGGTPGGGDQATHGTPAKFSYCIAENDAANPWQPFHVEKGLAPEDSAVTVMAAEAPHNIQDHFSVSGLSLLHTIAGSLHEAGSNNLGFHRGNPLIVLGPEHAAAIARDGYSKEDVKRFVWERSKLYAADWPPDWPHEPHFAGELEQDTGQREWTAVSTHWSNINVIVAGGAGKHSCWLPTAGHITATVTRRIERRNGAPILSVHDLRA